MENNLLEKAQKLTQQNKLSEAIECYKILLENEPNQPPHVYVKLGEVYIKNKNLDAAENTFQELKEKYPNNLNGYQRLGQVAALKQNWELAIERWNDVLSRWPNDLWGLHAKGNALLNINKLDEAEVVFQERIAKHPDKFEGYEGLARVSMKTQDFELAIERWSELIERFPHVLVAYVAKGNTLLDLDKIEEAEIVFKQLIEKHPDKFQGYEGLARVSMKTQDFELAIERWSDLIQRFPDVLAGYVGKGNALLNLDKIEESEAIFQQLIEKHPDKFQGYEGLARVSMKTQDFELAIERWSELIERFPHVLAGYVGKANALLNLDKIEESEAIFQQLIADYPDKFQGYEGLARIAQFQENWNLAIEKWQAVIDKFPENMGSYINKSNCLMNLGKFEEAEAIIQELITNNPEKIAGYNGLINIAKRLGDWKLALERIEVALEIFPDEKSLYLDKIGALLQLLNFDEALELIKECQEKYSDDVKFIVAEANYYSRQFNHSESEKILESIKDSGKADFAISMQLARTYMLTGKLTESRAILEELLTTTQGKNNEVSQNLYIQILMIQKDYEHLKQYVKDNLNNTKFSKQIIYDYVNLLIMQESDQEAENLINDIISEKNDDPKIYKTQIRLVLLREQIRNLKALNAIENYQQFKEKLGNSNQIITELRNYLNDNPQHPEINEYLTDICDYFDRLSEHNPEGCFINTYLSLYDTYEIATKIIQHIQNKKPLSLIRLGDGEGHFLEGENEYQEYQLHDEEHIQRIWWGEVRITEDKKEKLVDQYHHYLNNADLIGIPNLYRFCRDIPIPVKIISNSNVRGITKVNNYINQNFVNQSERNCLLISNLIHRDLEQWEIYRIIFSYVKEISLISCHENLGLFLEAKFGLTVNKLYEIPSEYGYSHQFNHDKEYEQHYPHYFEKLCSEITVSYPGEVFIVGAGFLGKIYCGIIKERGGIALDLGSIVDQWLGYHTRPIENKMITLNYHAFLQKIIKTDPRIQKTDDNSDLKIINAPLYKSSNDYCHLNIYEPIQLFNHWNLAKKRLFKIIGHPRCGSQFTSYLFKQFGFDINHEKLGNDGICSWLITVKDLNCFVGDKNISYYTDFDYVIHYIRNPQDAIPSIMVENKKARGRSFNFRRNHILRELNYDIAHYETDMERAIASFLAWNKIAELQIPDLTLKVENCANDLHTFLESKSLARKTYEEIQEIVIDNKINNTYSLFKQEKPKLTTEDYQNIAPELREGLINFCESYGYDSSFLKPKKIINSLISTSENNHIDDKIHVKWWNDKPNFGDMINPLLVSNLSNKEVIHLDLQNPDHKDNYMVIGSILQKADSQSIIWGSGFMYETSKVTMKPKKVCAVRGPLTRKILLSQGIECPQIYGDPFLLYSKFYSPKTSQKHKLGIIPHHHERGHVWLENIRNRDDILIIDILDDPHVIIDQICSCEKIASSSLHGIIAADTYQRPSKWIVMSDKVEGNGFKFYDYFSSVNKKDTPFLIEENTTIKDLLAQNYNCEINIDLDKLYNSCPFLS